MYKKTILVFCALTCLLSAVTRASAQQTQKLKVAAYNIENAFDKYDDPYTRDEGTDVKLRWEYERIAGALKAIDADVVSFEEVENEQVLKALVDEYLPDMGYKYVAVPLSNDERGIKLGIISRLPIESITSYRWQTLTLPDTDQTWHFARGLMRVRLVLDDGSLINVFVVHLKSKRSTENDPQSNKWRTSEALRIRAIIDDMLKANPDSRIIIMGDYNSNPDDPAMTELLRPRPDGSQILSDSHSSIPMPDRTTFPSDRYPNTIFDYILTSPALTHDLVPGSAGIYNDPELTKGSDHHPVYATFEIPQ